jgi:hypothetical protein
MAETSKILGSAGQGLPIPSWSSAVKDPTFWNEIKNSAVNLVTNPVDQYHKTIDAVLTPADRASEVSKREYPTQDWDLTQRNALRHSMWVGGMARAMGAGADNPRWSGLATSAAKGVGYANEAASYLKRIKDGQSTDDPEYVRDTLHDLNANAVGTMAAAKATSDEDFENQLIDASKNARRGAPVGLLNMTDGRLSADPDSQAPK